MTKDELERAVIDFVWRCEMAKKVGGIALEDACEGKPVPPTWWLDRYTQYFLPPTVRLIYQGPETLQ